jgi:hypothetical protein
MKQAGAWFKGGLLVWVERCQLHEVLKKPLQRSSKWVSMVMATLICGGLMTATAHAKQGTAVVKAVNGAASYVDEAGISHPLALESVVKEGQTVKTTAGGSVTLYLAQNGPGIELAENSILRLDKLSSAQSGLGTIIDTRLDLRQGKLYGTVDKLLPGSHYEVRIPTGVATVRGTEFFIDAATGTVFVTSGTVNVTVTLVGSPGNRTRTVAVTAGQMLVIPSIFPNPSYFNKLAASPLPPGLNAATLRRLAQLGLLTRYTSNGNTSQVTETFNSHKTGPTIFVTKPPQSIVVSP